MVRRRAEMSEVRRSKAELDRWKREDVALWESAESCGILVSPTDKICEMIGLEVFHEAGTVPSVQIAGFARAWLATGNSHYLDLATAGCSELEISIPPTLQIELNKAAKERLEGRQRAGTAAKVLKKMAHDRAMVLMANLKAAGLSLEAAASKAAQHLHMTSKFRLKAGSLERLYVRSNGPEMEKKLRDSHPRHGQSEEWKRLAEALPDASDELRGNRR